MDGTQAEYVRIPFADNRLQAAKKFGATLAIHNDLGMEKALHASAVFGNAILERQPLKEQLPGNDSHGG